jgi:putative tricarboxylic transport membrane protein
LVCILLSNKRMAGVKKTEMRRETVVLVFWLFMCLYFATESWGLGLGTVRAPGSGFLPFWVSVVVGFLTVVQLLKELREKAGKDLPPLFRGKRIQYTLYTLGLLFAYPVLFDKIGFFLCTLLFVGACLRIIGKRRWLLAAGLSLFVAVASYTLFVIWLQIQFPRGRWLEPLLSFLGVPAWM